ncbi:MAG TPA: tetratricopeptide repeat protein [Anaerolineaceae bacterium]|nr:tetratricopeptide repeat protein [Anaerolineaceae bacterium]HQC63863.1 tetratricopeptide repeat protein [Anaerolineaceae bacterium]
MAQANIIDVVEDNFQMEVLHYSNRMPVVIDFWAPWCVPCKVQSQKLAGLAIEADGAFRLARINCDEQTKLAEKLKVTSLPHLKAFVDGRVVAEYTGGLSESSLRLFLDRILPQTGSLLLQKGKSLLLQGNYKGAEIALGQYVIESHGEPNGLLAYTRALLFLGQVEDALAILQSFPPSPEYQTAQRLRTLAVVLVKQASQEIPQDDPLAPAYARALSLAKDGDVQMTLDGLLFVLRKDRDYHQGQAKELYLGLLEVLSDDHPETRDYRSDLNAVLF